jgi:putative transposase
LEYIKPVKPVQNAKIERFNRSYREEVLDLVVFENLHRVRYITGDWILSYIEERPHHSLTFQTPGHIRDGLEEQALEYLGAKTGSLSQ